MAIKLALGWTLLVPQQQDQEDINHFFSRASPMGDKKFKKGDEVLIMEPNNPPDRGRITATYGCVVDIQREDGKLFTRTIHHLIPLKTNY